MRRQGQGFASVCLAGTCKKPRCQSQSQLQ
jgi:hypothetical protein